MASRHRVKVVGGVLEGIQGKSLGGQDYFSFKGVPYAEPPIGDLRFKAPIPKKPWADVYDATKEGNVCCQADISKGAYIGNEDCLYLNIHTPKLPDENSDEKLLPVVFYIHGGGFVYGSGSEEWFSPDFFVESDTILVNFNYRLGILGFLCLDTPEASGNAGLKDQNLALRWVQENIRAFNGDPDNITIYGISAGSASVEYHLLSPMSKGLFQKAILQSGSALNPWARTRDPVRLAKKLAKSLDINENDPNKLLQMLKETDVKKMVLKSYLVVDEEEQKNGEIFGFAPVVEKKFPNVEPFIDAEPLQLLEDGLINKVPTIAGFCENEGGTFRSHNLFPGLLDGLKKGKFIDYLPKSFNVDRIYFDEQIRNTYKDEIKNDSIDKFLSDLHFVAGIYESLKHRSRFTNTDYFYLFAYDGSLNFIKVLFNIQEKGAFHGDDTTYLSLNFAVKEENATSQDRLVRSRMVKMWTDFAKTGNPTPEQCELIDTEWIPATSHNTVLLEITSKLQMKKFPFFERMELWENIYESSVDVPRP